jgi:hypothetical protein
VISSLDLLHYFKSSIPLLPFLSKFEANGGKLLLNKLTGNPLTEEIYGLGKCELECFCIEEHALNVVLKCIVVRLLVILESLAPLDELMNSVEDRMWVMLSKL